jgi:hypothetical protein
MIPSEIATMVKWHPQKSKSLVVSLEKRFRLCLAGSSRPISGFGSLEAFIDSFVDEVVPFNDLATIVDQGFKAFDILSSLVLIGNLEFGQISSGALQIQPADA